MDMNSTGVCRFIAVCASFRVLRLLALVLCSGKFILAADCASGLSTQEKLARFKELDAQAESAMKQHRSAQAVQLYEQAVCLVPTSARAYFGLGMAQAAAAEFREARESLRTADQLQPTTGMPLLMQVRVNFSLQDIDALKSNLRDAASRFPHDGQLHTALARFLAEKSLFVLALAEAMRSQNGSDDWNARVQLAVLENTVGDYEDAIRNALAAEQNPQAPDRARGAAAGVAGLSYESLHQPEQAMRYLKEAIERDPSEDTSYLALADLFEQEQKYPEAVSVLTEARSKVPGSIAVLLPLGADLIRAERYKEGIAVLHELLQNAPDTPDAYISIADAARKTGDTSQEIAALRALVRYKPDYPMIHVLLARAMLNEQPTDYPKILDELSAAAKMTSADPDIFFLRGKVYIALNRLEDAIPALERSVELRPLEPGPYYQLARIYQKLGKTELAKVQFDRLKYLESVNAK